MKHVLAFDEEDKRLMVDAVKPPAGSQLDFDAIAEAIADYREMRDSSQISPKMVTDTLLRFANHIASAIECIYPSPSADYFDLDEEKTNSAYSAANRIEREMIEAALDESRGIPIEMAKGSPFSGWLETRFPDTAKGAREARRTEIIQRIDCHPPLPPLYQELITLRLLEYAARRAELRFTRGRTGGRQRIDADAHYFVRQLAKVYTSATGEQPGLGQATKFFKLVKHCFRIAGHPIADPLPYIKLAIRPKRKGVKTPPP